MSRFGIEFNEEDFQSVPVPQIELNQVFCLRYNDRISYHDYSLISPIKLTKKSDLSNFLRDIMMILNHQKNVLKGLAARCCYADSDTLEHTVYQGRVSPWKDFPIIEVLTWKDMVDEYIEREEDEL